MRQRLIRSIISVLVVLLVFSQFIYTLRKNVYDTQLTNMQELADHDINTINNFLDDDWEILENTASKAALEKLQSDEDIVSFLRKEVMLSQFEDYYLVDETYHLYNATGAYNVNNELFDRHYLAMERVMSRADILNDEDVVSGEYIFSAIRLNGVVINGHRMIEIIGKLDLNKIQDRIRISNYGGKGYSSVFDKNGAMIIGISANGQRLTNYFDYLLNSTDLDANEIEEIKQKIKEGERFTETVQEIYSKQTSIVMFQPIEGMSWYFILTVPKSVFDEQNSQLLSNVLFMILVVTAGILYLLAIQYRARVREERQKEEMKQKEELQRALDLAESANRAKTTFLFNMSHDIRTPLNAIIGFTELAEKNDDNREKSSEYRKKVLLASKQLLSILNNILEMARIESDKLEVTEELSDTKELFDACTTVFEGEMANKGLRFRTDYRVTHRYLYFDKTHLTEVIMNLVSNSMKYTPGGGEVVVTMSDHAGNTGEECILETVVRDTGMGMSEEFLRHIFDEFSRERNSSQSGIQGTGLGMAIVKRLIDLMKGSIDIQSKEGEGTQFTVRIPLRIGDEQHFLEANNHADTEAQGCITFEGKRILLAEDMDVNAILAQEILGMQGFLVERAKDGQECREMLEKAENGYYDLILMDIQMPIKDGYMATNEIRSLEDPQKASIPIIALSANAFKEDVDKSRAAGMNAHIAKPIDVKELTETLQHVLQKRRSLVMEQLLAENGLNMEEILSSETGIYCADDMRRIVFWNRAAEKLTGYRAADVIGKHCFHTGLDHQNLKGKPLCNERCPMIAAIIDGDSEEQCLSCQCKNGQREWLNVHVLPLYMDGEIRGAIEYFSASKEEIQSAPSSEEK